MKRTSSFMRALFGVLGVAFLMSLVDDDLFLQQSSANFAATVQKRNRTYATLSSSQESVDMIRSSTGEDDQSATSNETMMSSSDNNRLVVNDEDDKVSHSDPQSLIRNESLPHNIVDQTVELNKTVVVETKEEEDKPPIFIMTNVIKLSGEMGNHLSRLAHGFGISWMLEEDYNITTRIMLRHQKQPKWVIGHGSITTCFPNLRELDFGEANTDEFSERYAAQRTWLGENNALDFKGRESEESIREILDTIPAILANTSNSSRPAVPTNANITLPFVQTNTYGNYGYINDRYYERLRRLFAFDYANPKCCSSTVTHRPDEVALHIRGFLGEMPQKGLGRGFEELSPNKTVHELLLRLAGNTTTMARKVALLGRYESAITPYLESLNASGFDARYVPTANGEQSFCFLLSARELIGISQSTFALWAAYLGNSTFAHLYSIKSPARLERYGSSGIFWHYNYTNPTLKQKISFELYNSEAQDLVEQKQTKLRS